MAEDLSYEELVDHIVTNKPIPNVVQVPDVTYDESERTQSELKPRPKPWELQDKLGGVGSSTLNEPLQNLPEIPSNVRLPEELEALTQSGSTDTVSNYYAREAELDAALKNDQ